MFKLCGLLVAMTPPALVHASVQETAHVLVLHSYHAGYPGTDDIMAGLLLAFANSGLKIDTKVEYLDAKNYQGPAHDTLVLNTLKQKYADKQFSVIVTSDDYAYDLLEKHGQALFGNTPNVFVGTNYFDEQRLKNRSWVVGVDEAPSFQDTLNLVMHLRPKTKKVIAIYDDTVTGLKNYEAFKQAVGVLPGYVQVVALEGLTLENLTALLSEADSNTSAIYFASLVRKADGGVIFSNEALEVLAEASSVPLYGGWKFSLGHGIVGGRLIDLHEHGKLAGQLAVRILSGESVTSLHGLLPSPNVYLFDHAQLLKHQIDAGRLPEGVRVINQPVSFVDQYDNELHVAGAVLLCLVVGGSFVILNKSRRRLAQANAKLRANEAILHDMAHHDGLTGLPNRMYLHAHLEQSVSRVQRSGAGLAVMMIDLDGFKPINDQHGHDVGDAVLREVGRRLGRALRKADFVARIGGDEFVVVLEGSTDAQHIVKVADKVIDELSMPIQTDLDEPVQVGASVGVAVLAKNEVAQALLNRADVAMYEAKSGGKRRWHLAA